MWKKEITKQKHPMTVGKPVCLALAVSCLLVVGSVQAETVAGVVKKKVGTVEIVRSGASVPVEIGTRLQVGDVIKTSKNSGLGMTLKDETRMSLGAESQAALEKFSFDPNTYAGNLLVSVNKGTFAMISGLVAKNNPAAALVKTPTATATVRDSSFAVEVP
jgi:hypothetical protein